VDTGRLSADGGGFLGNTETVVWTWRASAGRVFQMTAAVTWTMEALGLLSSVAVVSTARSRRPAERRQVLRNQMTPEFLTPGSFYFEIF